jgi:hypothetical protein
VQPSLPFPKTAKVILPAQYSCLHHSMSLLLVSLPTPPPSPSISSFDGRRPSPSSFLAASVRLFIFPVPNLVHGWPGTQRPLASWNILRASFCRFFLFSESTALISRAVTEGVNRGEWKNPANRGRALVSRLGPTENQ